MVIDWLAASRLAALEPAQTLLQRLDPATRAKVLAALAALIILGFAMILLAWLGARATRRYMNTGATGRRRTIDADDWTNKPLVAPPKEDQDQTQSR